MAQADEKESLNETVSLDTFEDTAYWEWDDPENGGWIKFDEPTSNQIESTLKDVESEWRMKQKVDENNKLEGTIQIDLNQGPFFGSAENKGVYVVVINMGWNEDQLVIESAFQKNNQTAYKRVIRRVPPLGPSESNDQEENPIIAAVKKVIETLKENPKKAPLLNEYGDKIIDYFRTSGIDKERLFKMSIKDLSVPLAEYCDGNKKVKGLSGPLLKKLKAQMEESVLESAEQKQVW